VPKERGLDTEGILRAAVDGKLEVLVVLGADPVSDFPDAKLARDAIASVPTLIAVGGFLTQTSSRADVVLPTTFWGEKAGTVSNLEGRVQRAARKVAPEGTAMDDWRIAVELAARLGRDPDLATVEEVTDQIAAVAPAFARVDAALTRRARDGAVLPLTEHASELVMRAGDLSIMAEDGATQSWDPIKVEGAEPADESEAPTEEAAAPAAEAPPLHVWNGSTSTADVPARDAYALRLVAQRTLYDGGRIVTKSPLLSAQRPEPLLRANPADVARIGSGQVRVTTTRGTRELPLVADDRVPPGIARYDFTGDGEGPAALIDAAAPVTDLRVESVR
jgi:NADH-quinone oxidoreductase subunit G